MIEDISSAVLNINVPTLVLAGENDQVERVATLAQESIPLIRFRQLLMSD
jgi:pimeloyl-ACP methyl ester carboxylesterase